MSEQLTYKVVISPTELDALAGHSDSYENLEFNFSPEYIQTLKERLSEPNAIQIIATKDGQFAGYIAGAETIFPSYLFLSELFISPNFKGFGLATELINQAITFAKEVDLQGVMVETENENIPAQKLYEKLRFNRVENPDFEGVTYQLKF